MKKIILLFAISIILICCSKTTAPSRDKFEQIREKFEKEESILIQVNLNNLPFGASYEDTLLIWNNLSIICPQIISSRSNINNQSSDEYQIIIFHQKEENNDPYDQNLILLVNQENKTPEEIKKLYLIDIKKIEDSFVLKTSSNYPGVWTDYWIQTNDFQNFEELGWHYNQK